MNKYRIMIVDDSSTNNILYESILADEGYDILVSEDSKAALNRLKKELPDLLLLDLMMPGMDGFHFMQEKNTDKSIKNIPVVMVTAKADKESEQKAYDLGVKRYLTKPVGIMEIVQTVKEVLNK